MLTKKKLRFLNQESQLRIQTLIGSMAATLTSVVQYSSHFNLPMVNFGAGFPVVTADLL
jgi:hypothetical protein